MVSALNDPSLFKNNDTVAVADSGESVGNDEGGSAFHQFIHTILYQTFCSGIDGAGGFIQDQHRRIGNCCPCDGKQLTLTVAESRKEKPMSVDVQAKLTYSRRGAVKNFDVVAGSEITLSGAKYTISEIKTVGDGAEITVENGLTGKKRKLVSP